MRHALTILIALLFIAVLLVLAAALVPGSRWIR